MDASWDILNTHIPRMNMNMQNLTMWANNLWGQMVVAAAYLHGEQPTWRSYLWEEMTDAADRLQKSPLFWGILAVWMLIGVFNMVQLLGETKTTVVYRTAKPSWEPRRPTTRSMTRSTQYENAKTSSIRRRRELIFQPLP